MTRPRLTGIYINYKGNPYEVLGFGTNTETEEPYVIYQALYGEYRIWTRPESRFFGTVEVEGVTQNRLEFVGGARLRRLSQEEQWAARNWINTLGRPLEQAKYAWGFEGGSVDEVYFTLAAYQNADGGFGHGLEPDLQTPDSSALATTVALQTLRHVGATAHNPLVQGALRWLADNYDANMQRWPFIPPTANNAPHAPWWTVGEQHAPSFGEYLINPRAEILGYLYEYREAVDPALLDALSEKTIAHIEATSPKLNMHDLLCAKRLIGAENLDANLRERVTTAAIASLPGTVLTTAEEFEGYGLRPTQLAQHPRSAFVEAIGDEAIQLDLDLIIDAQDQDGAWHPVWSWGGMYDEAWGDAERAWSSVLTFENMCVLRDWGRLAL